MNKTCTSCCMFDNETLRCLLDLYGIDYYPFACPLKNETNNLRVNSTLKNDVNLKLRQKVQKVQKH
jgi:hypothetical protein